MSNLAELLDQALGSGEDAGAVNFNLLKSVLGSVLDKLEIANDTPKDLPSDDKKSLADDKKSSDLQNRLDDLGLFPQKQLLVFRNGVID